MKVQIINNSEIKTEIKELDLNTWVHKVCGELYRSSIEMVPFKHLYFFLGEKQKQSKTLSSRKWRTNQIGINKTNAQPQELDKNLTLAFVSEQYIQKLNKEFRKKNSVTDILSFAPVEEDSLGEIALCPSFIYRTKPSGFSKREWLFYLILHGMLHLLGFDHENNPDEARKMYHLQDTIFKKCIDG